MKRRAKPGDITIDFDDLAGALSPGAGRDLADLKQIPDHVEQVTRAARIGAIDEAMRCTPRENDVYVIYCDPTVGQVRRYQSRGAEIVALDPGYDECMRRARAERTPQQQQLTHDWYAARGLAP